MDISNDPFQDPVLPSQADQLEQPAPSSSYRVPSVRDDASQISGQEVSNIQHSSNFTPTSQTGTDAILPVHPGYPPVPGVVRNDFVGADGLLSLSSPLALSQLVTRRGAGEPADRSPDILKKGKRKIYTTKWIFIITFLAVK